MFNQSSPCEQRVVSDPQIEMEPNVRSQIGQKKKKEKKRIIFKSIKMDNEYRALWIVRLIHRRPALVAAVSLVTALILAIVTLTQPVCSACSFCCFFLQDWFSFFLFLFSFFLA